MNLTLNTIYNEDCLETMKRMPDNFVDLVLTDPPYGKMWTRGKHAIGLVKHANETDKTPWDIKPSKEVFHEMRRISKQQIIFGGNYFTDYLEPSNCWLVWDKLDNLKLGKQIPFAHCELAWTSFNKTVKKYTLRQQGFINDSNDQTKAFKQRVLTKFAQAIVNEQAVYIYKSLRKKWWLL